jgi:4-amino-4-deoxy-L-arabinose transferase-like glycosyltransferase
MRGRLAIATAACLAAAVVLRIPALDQPLDRDSALYAAIGQRLSPNTLPYRDLFDHKQPLIHWLYGGLNLIAPGSLAGIRLAAAVPSALVAAGLFAYLQRVVGPGRAVLAAALVIVVSASTTLQGTDLNTEHLLALPAAATILWALALGRPGVRGGPFVIGIVGGIAILAKATGALTALVALIPLLATRDQRGQSVPATVIRFGLGVAIPVGIVVAVYAAAGAVDDLVFANLTYNSRYVGSQGFTLTPRGPETVELLVAAGLCCGLVRLASFEGRDVIGWTFLAWLLAAWLGAQTSSRGFAHYYAPVVAPAVALLVLPPAPATRLLTLVRGGALAVAAVAAVAIAVPVVTNFGRSGDEIMASVYSPEELALSKTADVVGPFLRRRQGGHGALFVAGSEPEYYWRSGLPNANRWLFDFPADVAPERFGPDLAGLCLHGPRFVVLTSGRMPPYVRHCTAANGYREILRRGPAVVLERSAR